MAAVVLGTALTAFGTSPAVARQTAETSPQAVQDISRYCTACWRNARLPADCWNDCTQEVFTRLLQTVSPAMWNRLFKADGAERLEFVRAIDAVKKRAQRRLKKSRFFNGIVADYRSGGERQRLEEREMVHQAAQEVLSARQQRILQMSLEGWSVHEIAGELKLPAERISDEKYKAIRKLREHLQVA
jgi:RNA polymerase sigma factor (sigma-70 family)